MAAKKPVAIEIKGLKETLKALRDFPEELDEMKGVHERVGKLVLASAQSRMPNVTGKLQGSYKVGRIKRGAKISSSLVYAPVSEFGGSIPRYASSTRTKHKPTAKSQGLKSFYVYPAVDENRTEIERLYEHEIKNIAKKLNLEG